MAVGEQCCLYANHSGVIMDSMAPIRKRLHERQLEKKKAGMRDGMNLYLIGHLVKQPFIDPSWTPDSSSFDLNSWTLYH